MKKILYSFIGFSLFFVLSGCSDDPSIDNHPKEQVVPGDNEVNPNTPEDTKKDSSGVKSDGSVQGDQDAARKMKDLPFTKFDLEVQYQENNEFDFSYEQKSENGDYEAELEDSINDKLLKGMEAFNALYTQLKDIGINAETTEDEAIQKILEQFQLDENYTSFDLEYLLKDGTKLDFEVNK